MTRDIHTPLYEDDDDDADATKITTLPKIPVVAARAPKASLVVVYVPIEQPKLAADLGRRVPIETSVTIGRHMDCALKLEHDELSRRHAEVIQRGGRFFIRDLGSRNGTLVNDELLQEERELADGDRIQVGLTYLKFIQSEKEDEFHETIYKIKVEDALTGINNKRYLMDYLDREVARASRHRSPLALTMFDIDHFKRVNDTWGHLAGDTVLREVAGLVKRIVRKEDCFARYGGEEFALVQPEVSLENAALTAEKIRQRVEAQPFVWDGHRIPVTVSLGTSVLEAGVVDPLEFIRISDERLYEAKRTGRNRVVAS